MEKDDIDIGYCLTVMEGIFHRACVLKNRLEKDKRRVMRRMERLEQDRNINFQDKLPFYVMLTRIYSF